MALDNFHVSLLSLLKHEGGYVNDPKDPGGMTNLGVTKKVWESWVGRPVTEADMRALTPVAVGGLYKVKYWDKVRGDALPSGLDYCMFDFAVNSGVGRATKTLQLILDVDADGMLGKATLSAIADGHDAVASLVNAVCDRRQKFLEGLSTFSRFGKGWTRRVAEVRHDSLAMTYARR